MPFLTSVYFVIQIISFFQSILIYDLILLFKFVAITGPHEIQILYSQKIERNFMIFPPQVSSSALNFSLISMQVLSHFSQIHHSDSLHDFKISSYSLSDILKLKCQIPGEKKLEIYTYVCRRLSALDLLTFLS